MTATGPNGGYAFLGLTPGTYDVRATKGGLSASKLGVLIVLKPQFGIQEAMLIALLAALLRGFVVVFVKDLTDGSVTQLTSWDGYDAEATISPMGDRIVFTSTRSGAQPSVLNEDRFSGGAWSSTQGRNPLGSRSSRS